MFKADGTVRLSASDLVGHLNCHHLTELDLAVSNGELFETENLGSAS